MSDSRSKRLLLAIVGAQSHASLPPAGRRTARPLRPGFRLEVGRWTAEGTPVGEQEISSSVRCTACTAMKMRVHHSEPIQTFQWAHAVLRDGLLPSVDGLVQVWVCSGMPEFLTQHLQ